MINIPSSRPKYIAIIVNIFRAAGYSLEKAADKMGISMAKFLKWMRNSPDLSEAMGKAVKDDSPNI